MRHRAVHRSVSANLVVDLPDDAVRGPAERVLRLGVGKAARGCRHDVLWKDKGVKSKECGGRFWSTTGKSKLRMRVLYRARPRARPPKQPCVRGWARACVCVRGKSPWGDWGSLGGAGGWRACRCGRESQGSQHRTTHLGRVGVHAAHLVQRACVLPVKRPDGRMRGDALRAWSAAPADTRRARGRTPARLTPLELQS